jgi:hypothetical protein
LNNDIFNSPVSFRHKAGGVERKGAKQGPNQRA